MDTQYGKIIIEDREQLFAHIQAFISESVPVGGGPSRVVGLTGGSTPKAFYRWMIENKHDCNGWDRLHWSVTDERMVALEDDESNFGNADRLMLEPMGIADSLKMPWPVQVDPHSASSVLNRRWTEMFGFEKAFDLCFLGMGDDGHTASIFPGSPLLGADIGESFTCVDVPGKGWRLTITEAGLQRCERIVVLVTGAAKAQRLKAVLNEPQGSYPIQILSKMAAKVVWLVDREAAAELS
jgi:6-phosphogluconolactonase